MKSVLVRTGSVPVLTGSPKISLSVQDSIAGVVFSSDKATPKKMSLHFLQNNGEKRNVHVPGRSIRRAFSESNVIQAENDVSRRHSALTSAGSRSFTARIPEEEHFSVGTVDVTANYAGNFPGSGISVEELGFNGGGIGKGKITGGGGGGGGGSAGDTSTGGYEDQRKIGAYYQEMLKSNPGDSLLLRNYGKFLHEVEGDTVRAEEYYGRAILASPGDGEVLSLYGKLIWETQRDETRAKSYFDQALFASPTDCMVLGSYARFMWEVEEDEDEEEMIKREAEIPPASMVAAF